MKPCSQDGCNRPGHARRMCKYHYNQWQRKTDITSGQPSLRDDILAALPATCVELVAKLGCHPVTVARWIKRLRADKAIRVGGWQRRAAGRGTYLRVFHRGSGPDAPCTIKPTTASERNAKMRATHPERYTLREKARWARKKALRTQNTWHSTITQPTTEGTP